MINLVCPVCSKLLQKKEKAFVCSNGHSFDIAKEGYLNLLLSNKKNSALPGDNKEMVNARDMFLNEGYYSKLVDELISLSIKHKNCSSLILDAGSGTGYYSIQVKKNRNLDDQLIGVDISKFAAQKAAKKDKESQFVVASCFDLPIENKSVDILLNIFSPKAGEEFLRVLKDDGILIEVMAGEEHMLQLKQAIYKDVRLNEVEFKYDGFNLIDTSHIKYDIHLDSNEKIHSHIAMTPYYYKSQQEDLKKLDKINEIDVTIDFYIAVWKIK